MGIGPSIGSRVGSRISTGIGAAPNLIVRRTWLLTKTGGVTGTYDAQAYTTTSFSGNVSVQFTVADTDECGMGLSADNPDAHYNGIDFLLLLTGGSAFRSANGTLTSLGTTIVGDVWKVSRAIATGVVSIFKNGAPASTPTFLATSVAPLIADSFFRNTNDAITAVSVSTDVGHQALTWTTTNVTAVEQ